MLGQQRRQRRTQRRFAGRAGQIGHQPQIARRVLARHHHGLRDSGLRLKRGFDLAQFQTVAA